MSGLRSRVGFAVRRLAGSVPAGWIRHRYRHRALGFVFHAACEPTPPHLAALYPCLTPEELESFLGGLRDRFTILPYEVVAAAALSGEAMPPHPAWLSFDDGLAECFHPVAPILERLGLPCTFFLTTDLLDNRCLMHRHAISLCLEALAAVEPAGDEGAGLPKPLSAGLARVPEAPPTSRASLALWLRTRHAEDRPLLEAVARCLEVDLDGYLARVRPYLSIEQAAELRDRGFTLGAHGRSHRDLRRLSRAEAKEEILASCRFLRDAFGLERVPFAFPYSAEGIRPELLAEARAADPAIELFFGSAGLAPERPRLRQRIWCEDSEDRRAGRADPDAVLRRAFGLRAAVRLREALAR